MRVPSPAKSEHSSRRSGAVKHPAREAKAQTLKTSLATQQATSKQSPPSELAESRASQGPDKREVEVKPDEVRPPALSLRDLECVRKLGKYLSRTIERKGAYGSVLLVRVRPGEEPHEHDRPGSIFAVKVLQKDNMQRFDKKYPKETDDERGNLVQLPWSPWINGVVGAFHDELNLYLMLECIPSGVLHDLIYKRGPFDTSMARFYYANIVCALEFLHLNDIVHRDLKPANILIKPDGYLAIADFGLSKPESDAMHGSWSLVGTPAYMAPELQMCQAGVGRAVDWFSSGVILYEMITKRVPYYGKDEEDIFLRVAAKKYKWPKSIRVGKMLKSMVAALLTHHAVERLGHTESVTSHPWLNGIDWKKMNGHRYIAPYVPGEVHLSQTWQDRRLPGQNKVPGLQVVVPPEHLRHDHRLPRGKDPQQPPADERPKHNNKHGPRP
ncbi:hypothetical protein HYDPIDRAFT_164796 [Hydnomerulius pinastri MD-312]|nr:hypothetical protein HYDPIDRAFT_164796 [Hydnomerulius pinastri MD-312]